MYIRVEKDGGTKKNHDQLKQHEESNRREEDNLTQYGKKFGSIEIVIEDIKASVQSKVCS